MTLRLAMIVSHPIQYFAPVYRALASEPGVAPEVLFLSDHGVAPALDRHFGREVRFDVPLTDGYPHRFVPNRSPRPDVSSPSGLWNPELARILTRERYDVISVHGYNHLSSWLAFVTATGLRTPFLLRGDSNLQKARPTLNLVAKELVLRALVKASAGCLCIGTENERYWARYGAPPEKLFRAPMPVDNGFFSSGAARATEDGSAQALRREAGVGADEVLLLFAGKLVPWKGVDTLIEATARLSKRHPVRAVVVGDGPLRSEFERLSASLCAPVHFAGFANQSQLPAWHAASDLHVLPSRHEAWGLVVNEAMACGKPVVASDACGCAVDLIRGRGTGESFSAGDADSLVNALEPLVGDASLRRRAGEAARALIAGYDVAAAARGLAQAARAVAGR